MNNEQNDGGPAYPVASTAHLDYASICGMSLRDYFAAAALQGMLSSPQYMERAQDEAESVTDVADCFAIGAYQFADAMLAERERKP